MLNSDFRPLRVMLANSLGYTDKSSPKGKKVGGNERGKKIARGQSLNLVPTTCLRTLIS